MECHDFFPVPWWVWTGKMNKTEMLRQLRLMKKTGIKEFFIFPNYGLEHPAFLSENWWDYVSFTLRECKKMDLGVWIYDDLAWPSGTAAGKVLQEHPEFRTQLICCNKRILAPGGTFIYSGGKPVEVLIRKGDEFIPVELDERNSYVNSGDETIELNCIDIRFYNGLELGCQRAGGTWKQRGYIDMMSPDAVRMWMEYIHIPYKEKFGSEFGKTLRGFFFDEPTLTPYNAYFGAAEVLYFGQGPCVAYSPGFFDKFQARFGYTLQGKLHSLFYDTAESFQVRSNFWALASELMSIAFGKTVSQWCTDNGVMLTGHSNAEEPVNQRNRVIAAGDIWQMQKYQHIPGADLLFYRTPFRGKPDLPVRHFGRNSIFNAKLPGSIARYSGASRAMVEAFGVRGGNGTMAEQKDINNYIGAMGVNFINDNTLVYTMSAVESGKSFNQPWFKHYNIFYRASENISRFAAFGRIDTAVAVLTPETTIRSLTPMARDIPFDPATGSAMIETLWAVLSNHIDFELIFEEVIAASPVADGEMRAPDSAFKVIILPDAKVLSESVAAKLCEFCSQGGKLIFVNRRPETLDSRPLNAAESSCFNNFPLLNNDDDLPANMSREIGKVVQLKYHLAGENANQAVTALRKDGSESKLFISNQGDKPLSLTLNMSDELKGRLAAFDTDSGRSWQLETADDGSLPVELFPEQSIILEKSDKTIRSRQPEVFGIPKAKIMQIASGAFEYRLDRPNSVTCSMEMAPVAGKMIDDHLLIRHWVPVDRSGFQDSLFFTPQEYPYYWVRASFDIAGAVPEDLELILPDKRHTLMYFNDRPVGSSGKKCDYYNPFNRKIKVADFARQGENTMLIRVRTAEWYDMSPMRNEMPTLPPVVLTGSFSAFIKGTGTVLKELPEKLTFGPIEPQGFSQYCGEISYIISTDSLPECRRLQAGILRCGSLEVLINGRKCGVRAWEPYIFDVSGKLTRESNLLTLKLTTAFGNLLPGGYSGRELPQNYGIEKIEFYQD